MITFTSQNYVKTRSHNFRGAKNIREAIGVDLFSAVSYCYSKWIQTILCYYSCSLPMAKKLVRSDYFYSLKKEEQKRYLAKLTLVGGVDPYTISDTDFSQDVGLLPSLR